MNNLTLKELQPLIIKWAKDKELIKEEIAPKQRLKLIEECGELASAILKQNKELQKDAIGDIFVVLIILAEQLNTDLTIFLDEEFGDTKLSIESLLMNICFTQHEPTSEFWMLYELSNRLNLNTTDCANIAWNEIKNRTGKTLNGTFIKD